ncbi:GOLPH3/VPS74 family protein [Streptomyces beigongshangae]|uniref:GOLPH3/VPS74 family protein n=1 Tax=Streptomyces beigongshangae TaxID=2841597 RepID=UPI001C847580|nr:GPP34 family phosphoprotein [Streptomyces sp. REN17]
MLNGPLSLPARLYLLAWDTTKGKVTAASQVPHLVRAGALTELAQRGLLADADGVATPTTPDGRTGDPALDGLLELVEESRPHKWKTWVTLRARITLDAVEAQLAADGYLRAEKTRVLGVFPSVDYEIDRVAVVEGLREEARLALTGPVPVEEVSARDAALVSLAAAAELRTLLSAEERRRYEARVAALAERSGPAAPTLHQAVQEVRSAVAAAVTMTAPPGD